MKKLQIYNKLPELVKAVLLQSYGWLVGNAPSTLIEGGNAPKDYDIIIENRGLYQDAVKFLSASGFDYIINSWGGCKFTKDDLKIDIWCEEIGHFLQVSNQIGYIYHFRRAKLLQFI